MKLIKWLLSRFRRKPKPTHVTTRDGYWGDPGVWDTGTVPEPGDYPVVSHRLTTDADVTIGSVDLEDGD